MSFWQGRKVLVTGGAGFIGSHLAERLVQEGATLRVLAHYHSDGSRGNLEGSPLAADMEIIAGDIRDSDSVNSAVAGCEIIMHLCALVGIPYSYHAMRSYVETNTAGTLNVLQASQHSGVARLVHTSTSEVYGTAQQVPIPESHPLVGQSPYSASKIAADKLAEAYHRSFALPVVTLRPFNTFGPRQSTRAIIPTIISQCLAGGPIHLGNLAPTRDLNYVDNTVDGFLLAGSVAGIEGRTINVGSGRETRIGELALLIRNLIGADVAIEQDPQRLRPANSEVDRLVCDNTLARELLGWTPRVSLEEGLLRTIEWMRENIGRYRVHEYAV